MPQPGRLLRVGLIAAAVLTGGCGSSGGQGHVAPTPHEAWRSNPLLVRAVHHWAGYVDTQLTELVGATTALTTAVDAGDWPLARTRYPAAHIHYERVEPVAEIWGSLDLAVDGRANDFVGRAAFTGFHRLEQLLWSSAPPTVSLARPVASDLLARVTHLRTLAAGTDYTLLQLTSGATELLNEVEASKITGEEERYSHLDLVDLRGNLDGAEEVITTVRPALRTRAPTLLTTIDRRTAELEAGLARYRADPGYDGTGFVRYSAVTTAQRRQLAALVQALAESVALTTGSLST